MLCTEMNNSYSIDLCSAFVISLFNILHDFAKSREEGDPPGPWGDEEDEQVQGGVEDDQQRWGMIEEDQRSQ